MGKLVDKALSAPKESGMVDFKTELNFSAPHTWCELIKDILAMANSGGGVILVGVDDSGKPSGAILTRFCPLIRRLSRTSCSSTPASTSATSRSLPAPGAGRRLLQSRSGCQRPPSSSPNQAHSQSPVGRRQLSARVPCTSGMGLRANPVLRETWSDTSSDDSTQCAKPGSPGYAR